MKKILTTILMISGSFAADNSDRLNNQCLETTNMRTETSIRTRNHIVLDGVKNQKLINFANEQLRLGKSTKEQYDRVIKKLTEKKVVLNKEVINLIESSASSEAQESPYIQAVKKFLSPITTLFTNALSNTWNYLCAWY